MNKNLSRYFQLFLVVSAAGAIYPLVYLRQSYQETILLVFNMSLAQMNMIYSILGIVFIIGYFPSGILSDKFSAKKLIALSMFGSATAGFIFAQVPDFKGIIFVYFLWGIFTVFTFWCAHMKMVKMLSTPEEEGRFFGFLDGGRGIIEAILASISIFVFAKIMGVDRTGDKQTALVTVIYIYSAAIFLMGILVLIFVKDQKHRVSSKPGEVLEIPKDEPFEMKYVGVVFRNKTIFLMGSIIFLAYAMTWTRYYFSGFLETNIKLDAVDVGKVMAIYFWMRPIGGIGGGILADKIGKTKVLGTALVVTPTCLILMSVLPTTIAKAVFILLVLSASVFIFVIRGTYWSILGNCNVDSKVMGTAIGVISVVGYMPDIILPMYNNFLFEKFGSNGGYNAYFITSAIMGLISAFLVYRFHKSVMVKK